MSRERSELYSPAVSVRDESEAEEVERVRYDYKLNNRTFK